MQRITIYKVRRGVGKENINAELQWLGTSLGLFGLRDKDSSCFRLFIALVRSAHDNHPLSSDEIAKRLNLTRGTVVHHLHRLMESGIVIKEKDGYILREGSLSTLMNEIHSDVESIFAELKRISKEIDEDLG